MARSPIDAMIDRATGFDTKMIRKTIMVECNCGNKKTDYLANGEPKTAVKIVTTCCPKCGTEADYFETFFDGSGRVVG